MAGQPDEAKELSLIGKVELRIGLADSDQKLETTLKTYLPPLLLKLASPHPSVRNKVISVCSHVNTRIQPETIKLPVQALVEQFKSHRDVALVRHFDLLYIHRGVPRLSAVEKNELFPIIIKGISASSQTTAEHASQILNLVFRLIEYFKFPSRGTEQDQLLRKDLDLGDEDTAYLAEWFGKLVLFSPVKGPKGQKRSCPGLTTAEYSFLSLQDKDDTWLPSAPGGLNVAQTRARVARLLASGIFNDKERFMPAIFASADAASAVSDAGEDMLKRAIPNTDFENETLIKQLFIYFFGMSGVDGRQRARAPLRLKILNMLSKSLISTTFTNDIIEMVDEGLSIQQANGHGDPMQIDQPSAIEAVQQITLQLTNGTTSRTGTGLEAAKLRTALFSYVNFVARQGKADSLHAIAPRVLTRLRDFVEEQGWPKAASATSQQELESRAYAYEVMGLLARAGPKELVVDPNLDILRWLFRSLADDRSSAALTVSIEEALSTVLTTFSRTMLEPDVAEPLETLLLDQMAESTAAQQDAESTRRSTRYVAVRFANRCLPFSSVRARGIDLMAAGAGPGERSEVIEEGQRGLSPYWYRMLNGSLAETESLTFPKFAKMMRFVFYELSYSGRTLSDRIDLTELVEHLRSAQPNIFAEALLFCRQVLIQESLTRSAEPQIALGTDWERKLDAAIETNVKLRTTMAEDLKSISRQNKSEDQKALELLLRGFASSLTSKEPLPASSSASEVPKRFISMCALIPDDLVGSISNHYQLILPNVLSNNHALRTSAARAFGILASHSVAQREAAHSNAIVKGLANRCADFSTAIGAVSNQINGSTLALAYYYSRLQLRNPGSSIRGDETFRAYFATLYDMLTEANDVELKKAAFLAIGELCLYQVIRPDDFKDGLSSVKTVVDRIADVAKTGNEQAALALGYVSTILAEPEAFDAQALTDATTALEKKDDSATPAISDSDASTLLHITARLHKLHEIRTAESHFAVGEALSILCTSWSSSALATALDVPCSPPTSIARNVLLPAILSRTLKDCSTTKPSLRKASVIWLLCLVQFCGHLEAVQQRLTECQAAFTRCLVDRDDLVQETASRGLGLVYEKGTPQLRKDLVHDLMNSFSADARSRGQSGLAGSVGADTQLFEPGQLPTGEGQSVSTYRDIMNLASEVGDSSLVYRFMSLASSNAVWSSRAAFGKFGLGTILGDGNGGEDYLKENPKVIVSLYRYRFDPNEGVRRSMNGIWNSLVKDTSKTVEKHFDPIVEDLLGHILGREWRTRQACCAALAELVQGRPLEKYESYLERIWDVGFKVLDDIKDSVRTAAASLARTLVGILTRTLEADSNASKNATKMLTHVLPFLLSPSGLESSAKEVQLFAVRSLLDIIKKSSAQALRPFIPDLVERLLGLIGSLEPEAVEYIRLNAKKYDVTEQKIDDMRLSGVRSSPIMEAIERCLDMLDDETMQKLQSRIESAMKSAIALPSKVACSRVLVSLSTRRSFVFKPYADGFLKILQKSVLDRNDTVASSYATAAGYVARTASDKQLLQLVDFSRRLYFESDGDRDAVLPRKAVTAGDIIKAVSKFASDRFNSVATDILPFVFIAKHDSHDTVKELFQDTWNDHVGGSRAISLYLKEIIALADKYMDSPQWAVKHTTARAIADAMMAMATVGLDESSCLLLWPRLEKTLAAKTWDGKEIVLDGFVKFVEKGESFWTKREDVKSAITKIAVREAKRQNLAYRGFSVPSLGKIAAARPDIDMSDTAYDVVQPIMDETLDRCKEDADAMDVDGKKSEEPELRQKLIRGCIEALSLSVDDKSTPDEAQRCAKVIRSLRSIAAVKSVGAEVDLGRGMTAALREAALVLSRVKLNAAADDGGSEVEKLLQVLRDG